MPYAITTLHPWADEKEPARRARTRHAVATLEEAHDYIGTMTDDDAVWNNARRTVTESGGTIGPLPDGTVITVEPVAWGELRLRLSLSEDIPGRHAAQEGDGAAVIDAYNAAQGVR